MKSGEKRLTQQQILGISFVIAIVMMYLAIILPSNINREHFFNEGVSPTDISPNDEGSSLTADSSGQGHEGKPPEQIESKTPASQPEFSTPIIGESGTNLPNNFKVGPWHDNNCDFNLLQKYIYINGVEIYGGTSPFNFSFWQSGEKITSFEVSSEKSQVKFPKAVQAKRDSYIHVILKFQSPSGVSEWSDDLMYSSEILCSEP